MTGNARPMGLAGVGALACAVILAVLPARPAVAAVDPVGFCDVAGPAFYRDAVLWGRETGVVNGLNDIRFSPDAATSRAEIVTMLHRFVTWERGGTPPPVGEPTDFDDVPDGAFFADAVRWAVGAGVTNGTSDTTFDPAGATTREQLAALVHRLRGGPADHPVTDRFGDLAGSSFPREISWLLDQGITSGTSPTTFSPERALTRGEIVTFLWRLAGAPGPAPATAPDCSYLIIGDSVMLGAVLYDGLATAGRFPGWTGRVETGVCRQPTSRGPLGCPPGIPTVLDELDAARSGGYLGDVVVIHTGTNDSTFSSADFDAIVAAADGADEIWFMNLRSSANAAYIPSVNAVIHDGVARWAPTGRVFLLDWRTTSTAPGVLSDGTHLTNPYGAQVYNGLIATVLD